MASVGVPLPMGPPGTPWGYDQLANEPPPTPTLPGSQGTLAPLVGQAASPAQMPERGQTESADGAGWSGSREEKMVSPRTTKRGWILPAVLLFVACFVQNAGLHCGTSCYVRWMDELAEPPPPPLPKALLHDAHMPACAAGDNVKCPGSERAFCKGDQCCPGVAGGLSFPCPSASPHFEACGLHRKPVDCLGTPQGHAKDFAPASVLQAAMTLDDVLARALQEHREQKKGVWGAEFSVDLLTSLVSVLWLGWVVRTHDLRLWTKTLLSAATLAALKGLLAWATVLPDPAGWQGCQERLGPDGLSYYRRVAANGPGAWQMFQDVLLLELRGFWMMGRASRQHICADTVYSAPTCFCVLLSASLYDAVRAPTASSASGEEEATSTRRNTAAALTGTLLVLVVFVELELMVSRPHHYTLDVVLALALTLLVYGNPAVAVAADRWAAQSDVTAGAEDGCDSACMQNSTSETLRDVGHIGVLPCCIPFCALSGQYYLREEPAAPLRRPWTAESKRQYERQVSEIAQIRERMNARRSQLVATLEEERRKGQEQASPDLIEQVDAKVQAIEQQLKQKEEGIVAEAMQRLEAARKARATTEAKVASELRCRSAVLAPLLERKARLEAEVAAARRDAGEPPAASKTLLPRLHGSFGDAALDAVCK